MKKKLEYFTGDITLVSKWDCDFGDITDVYDEKDEYVGTMKCPIGDITEDNFDDLAFRFHIDF